MGLSVKSLFSQNGLAFRKLKSMKNLARPALKRRTSNGARLLPGFSAGFIRHYYKSGD
jgi:hypothetical protein